MPTRAIKAIFYTRFHHEKGVRVSLLFSCACLCALSDAVLKEIACCIKFRLAA